MYHLCYSLVNILEFADDMAIDIPKIWEYLGEIVGPMIQDKSVPISFLRSIVEPLKPEKVGQFLANVLNDAASRLGHCEVGEQWRASGLSWEELLGGSMSPEEIQAVIRKWVSIICTWNSLSGE